MSEKKTVERVVMLVADEGDPRSDIAVKKLYRTGKDLLQVSSDFGVRLNYKGFFCSSIPLHLLSLFFIVEGMGLVHKNRITTIPELDATDDVPHLGKMFGLSLEGLYYRDEFLPVVMYIRRKLVNEYLAWLKMALGKKNPVNLPIIRWVVVALQEGRTVGLKIFGDTTVTTIDLRTNPPNIDVADIPLSLTNGKRPPPTPTQSATT